MTDLTIVLIGCACVVALRRLPGRLRPGATMTGLELIVALAAGFLFIYLLWAMLRPEDF